MSELLLSEVVTGSEGPSRARYITRFIGKQVRRLVDLYLHYGDFPTIRQRRAYLAGVNHAKKTWYPDMPEPEGRDTYWHDRVLRDRTPDRA